MGRDRERRTESLFKEIMAENSPNLGRDMNTQVHKIHRSPNRFNPKIFTKTHNNKTIKNQREKFKKQQEKRNSSHTREPPQAVNGFLSRNIAG